jgi:hypothetical protein
LHPFTKSGARDPFPLYGCGVGQRSPVRRNLTMNSCASKDFY